MRPGSGRRRQLLQPLRAAADHVIDSSRLNVHELKAVIVEKTRAHRPLVPMQVHVLSFGFKYGPAVEADLLVDVRFLLNPYFVPELKHAGRGSTGRPGFHLREPGGAELVAKYTDLIDYLLPLYEREGKSHLTIAVGCTGGRHRSVAIARTFYDHIAARRPQVDMIHRDIRQPL